MQNYINKEQIQHLLPMKECIEVMHQLFLLTPGKEYKCPLRSKMMTDSGTILGMMPASIKPLNVMGIKVLSVCPDNYKTGKSSHQGILHLFNSNDGTLLLTADAEEITAIRTAAVSALVSDQLCNKRAVKLCLIGSGKQAYMHFKALLETREILCVSIWSNSPEHDQDLAKKIRKQHHIESICCDNAKQAVNDADIICTVTGSKQPLIKNRWLKKGVHINAVGACTPEARELSSDIIENSDVYVDNYLAIENESGDLIFPAKENNCSVHDLIKADLHQLLINKEISPEKNTVFKSVGVAIEDVAAIHHCLKKLKKMDL